MAIKLPTQWGAAATRYLAAHGTAPHPGMVWRAGTGWVWPNDAAKQAFLKTQTTTTTAAATSDAATTTPAPTQADSAFQSLQGVLDQAGLGAFADIAWQDYKNGRSDVNLILSDIRGSNQYEQVFGKGAAALIKSGQFSNEGQISAYHAQIASLFHAYGINDATANTYLNADNLNGLALGGTSVSEIEQRLKTAQDAALASINPETRAELQRVTGMTTGDLTSFWLDPKVGLSQIQNDLNAAQIGGAADRTGFGQVDVQRLQDLASRGISADQAQQGFGALANEQQLFHALPGQQANGIDQNTQIAAQFEGNAAAQQAIENERRARLAAFAGSGGAAASQAGLTGLGVTPT